MNSIVYALLAVAICGICTFALRAIPFALFGGKRTMPPAVHRLAMKLPAAIIAVLVVYCLKTLPASDAANAAATLGSVAVVVLLHLWKKNTLLSIAGGTILYMALLRLI